MALAEYTHHASRGQTKARAREGVEHEKYEGLRAQKPPLPGKRPGVPPEPEPRGGAVTVGYVAAPAPPLAVPLLASAAGEAVDHSTLQFLLKHAIETKKAAVLGQGRCARVAQRQGYGQTVQKTVLVPQLQFIEGRQPPFVPQRQIPMVLPVQKTIETPQLQSVRWSMPLLCRSCLTCLCRCATTGRDGPDTAENCGGAAGAALSRLWTSL